MDDDGKSAFSLGTYKFWESPQDRSGTIPGPFGLLFFGGFSTSFDSYCWSRIENRLKRLPAKLFCAVWGANRSKKTWRTRWAQWNDYTLAAEDPKQLGSIGGCWRLREAVGGYGKLLEALGGYGRLLEAVLEATGGCWKLLETTGGCWRLLEASPHYRFWTSGSTRRFLNIL